MLRWTQLSLHLSIILGLCLTTLHCESSPKEEVEDELVGGEIEEPEEPMSEEVDVSAFEQPSEGFETDSFANPEFDSGTGFDNGDQQQDSFATGDQQDDSGFAAPEPSDASGNFAGNESFESTNQDPYALASDNDQTVQDEDMGLEGTDSNEPNMADESEMGSNGDTMTYIVKRGDTLSEICERIYGQASRWKEVSEANSMDNPHLIFPGQAITFVIDNQAARDFANSL